MFGPVHMEGHRAAILDDVTWILDDDHIQESPFYGILNCCHVLASSRSSATAGIEC
jgi:hypothetical protein